MDREQIRLEVLAELERERELNKARFAGTNKLTEAIVSILPSSDEFTNSELRSQLLRWGYPWSKDLSSKIYITLNRLRDAGKIVETGREPLTNQRLFKKK